MRWLRLADAWVFEVGVVRAAVLFADANDSYLWSVSVPMQTGRHTLCGSRTHSVAEAMAEVREVVLAMVQAEPSAHELAALALAETRIVEGERRNE